ncbi:MAG: hypothetical protein ACOYWZ_22350 [Bacillota bacterium]
MAFSEVIGFTLGDARSKLNKEGKYIRSIRVTSPPRQGSGEFDDYYRVINAIEVDKEGIELIVCKPL